MGLLSSPRPGRQWKWLLWALLPFLVVGLVLAGVLALGSWTRGLLRSQQAFQITLADVDCQPPAEMSRTEFLSEVQDLAGLSAPLSILEEDLPRRLVQAFSRHPWVESVGKVEILPDRQIRVRLTYRTPQLAVIQDSRKRAVDGHGILLPATAATEGLPVYCGPAPPPRGPPGTAWGDAALTGAAQTMAFVQGQAEGPRFALVESAVTGLILTTPTGARVFWGQPADDESNHHEAAVRKWDRLLRHCRKHGDLDHPEGLKEYDLRSLD